METPIIDDALLVRYHEAYGLARGTVDAEQARHHIELEVELTQRLLDSTPATRWQTFERCYEQLYEELPWLKSTGGGGYDPDLWTRLLGRPGLRVYEVGSGAGGLASALAAAGYEVTATDVSPNRGAREADAGPTWAVTDGVHLDQFAEPGQFDAVISDQVIEHLHPDDALDHFASARRLLKPGGRYIFRTPHRLSGPHDVSAIFGYTAPVGMHLREYTNRELSAVARQAGFKRLRSVMWAPRIYRKPITSRAHLIAMGIAEEVLQRVPDRWRRRVVALLRGPLRLDVMLIGET